MTSRRRRRGVSVAFSETAPPARTGSVSSAGPVRPRIANRSSSTASTAPVASLTLTVIGTTLPTSVSTATDDVAVTNNWAGLRGSGLSSRAAWSRCTRLNRPSTTGKPVSVTASPMAANTAGQQRPTRASGTVERVGAKGEPKVAVTPVWSATRSGSQSTVTVVEPPMSSGRSSGPSTPAAMASTPRIAAAASGVRTTGAPPSTTVGGSVKAISIQDPDSGTLRTTRSAATTSSRAPVEWLVAERLSCTCHCADGARRCTGLMAVRPAHRTSGESNTIPSGPVTSLRTCSREATGSGRPPAARTSSTAAFSKRSSNSPTGSSMRVIPATAAVPGMMHT